MDFRRCCIGETVDVNVNGRTSNSNSHSININAFMRFCSFSRCSIHSFFFILQFVQFSLDFGSYKHDLCVHMSIWTRLPLPHCCLFVSFLLIPFYVFLRFGLGFFILFGRHWALFPFRILSGLSLSMCCMSACVCCIQFACAKNAFFHYIAVIECLLLLCMNCIGALWMSQLFKCF